MRILGWLPFLLLPVLGLGPEKLYILHCMGCHGAQGEGIPGRIPSLKDVGYFTYLPEGRAFLIQVPGAANAPLSDEELAIVTNWILNAFSSQALPPNFRPFTASEVAGYRKNPLNNTTRTRETLLRRLREMGILKP